MHLEAHHGNAGFASTSLNSANSIVVDQLLLDARHVIASDVGAALRCIQQAASLFEAPVQPPVMPPARGGLARWQIDRIKRHIDDHIEHPIHVAELAGLAKLSSGYFSNAFKTSLGETPHAYVISRRLAQAKHLMRSSDKPLCEIAMDCGFSDQAHMCRQFRKGTGSSPNAWRRDHRNDFVAQRQ